MPLIGVRELRENIAEVLHQVREEKAEYVITYQGRPVAVLLPIDTEAVETAVMQASKQSTGDPWDVYERLADSLRNEIKPGKNTRDALDDIRRD